MVKEQEMEMKMGRGRWNREIVDVKIGGASYVRLGILMGDQKSSRVL